MADETDTTTEAARVIRRMLARALLAAKYDYSIVAESAPSIANALAEDGLLRLAGTDHLAEDLRENTEALMAARAQVEKVRAAMRNPNGYFYVADLMPDLRRALGSAQIATQEPAGATQPDSGGRGASGGLGERLRALRQRFIGNAGEDDPNNDQDLVITGYTFWAVVQGLEAMADEADRLEASSNGARIKVQLDRVVALADEWDRAAERRRESDPDMADAYRSRAADLRDVLAQEVP